MRTISGIAIVLALSAAQPGCGTTEAEVSGTVTVDNQPLDEGNIIFEEVDKSKTPATGHIRAGKYTVTMLPGSKTVRITASRPTQKINPMTGKAFLESMIPEEYNVRSSLTADIEPGKRDGVDFQVKSAPRDN